MNTSTNYGFNMPEAEDAADIAKISEAIGDIDKAIVGETYLTPTISVTSQITPDEINPNAGTINSITAKKYGMIVVIDLDCTIPKVGDDGGTIFLCSVSTTDLLPINPVHLRADGTLSGASGSYNNGFYGDAFTVEISSRNYEGPRPSLSGQDPYIKITSDGAIKAGRFVTSFAYICVGDQS